MAKFKGEIKQCVKCGKEFRVPPSRAEKAKYCSQRCHYEDDRPSTQLWRLCERCGKAFQTWPAWEKRGGGKYCSYSCFNEIPREPRFGKENSNWKGGKTRHSDGYWYIRAYGHPFSSSGYILEHRLVAENHLRQNDPHNAALIEIGGNLYLSPKYDVHHADGDRMNNVIENLKVLTKSEHKKLHEDQKSMERR